VAARRSYDAETKAAAMAALLAGQSIGQVADAYNIPEATIKSWKARTPDATVDPQKRVELGELISDYLRETLVTLKAQAVHFRDPAWLAKQPASELAVLHGVQTDKAIRLLSALDADDSAIELPPAE
jgi:transposase-like protein